MTMPDGALLAHQLDASIRREARLRRWLSKLERRAVACREARAELPDALIVKMPFVRGRLTLAVRRSTQLREQIAKVGRP